MHIKQHCTDLFCKITHLCINSAYLFLKCIPGKIKIPCKAR